MPRTSAPSPSPAKLNEWMQKVGHQMAYTTVACEGGFSSTIVLPLDGAGEAATCVGVATSKKMAETRAAGAETLGIGFFSASDSSHSDSKRTKFFFVANLEWSLFVRPQLSRTGKA